LENTKYLQEGLKTLGIKSVLYGEEENIYRYCYVRLEDAEDF
jgi:hypothetical protein